MNPLAPNILTPNILNGSLPTSSASSKLGFFTGLLKRIQRPTLRGVVAAFPDCDQPTPFKAVEVVCQAGALYDETTKISNLKKDLRSDDPEQNPGQQEAYEDLKKNARINQGVAAVSLACEVRVTCNAIKDAVTNLANTGFINRSEVADMGASNIADVIGVSVPVASIGLEIATNVAGVAITGLGAVVQEAAFNVPTQLNGENLAVNLELNPVAKYYSKDMSNQQLVVMQQLSTVLQHKNEIDMQRVSEDATNNRLALGASSIGVVGSMLFTPVWGILWAGIGAMPKAIIASERHREAMLQNQADQKSLKELDGLYAKMQNAEDIEFLQLVDRAEQIKYRWNQEHPTALIHELLPQIIPLPGASEAVKENAKKISNLFENLLSNEKSFKLFQESKPELQRYHELPEAQQAAKEMTIHYMIGTEYHKEHLLAPVPENISKRYSVAKEEAIGRRMEYEHTSCYVQNQILTKVSEIMDSDATRTSFAIADEVTVKMDKKSAKIIKTNLLKNLWKNSIEPEIEIIMQECEAEFGESLKRMVPSFRKQLQEQLEIEFKKQKAQENTVLADFHQMLK